MEYMLREQIKQAGTLETTWVPVGVCEGYTTESCALNVELWRGRGFPAEGKLPFQA